MRTPKSPFTHFVILTETILRDGHRMDASLSYLEEEESEDKKIYIYFDVSQGTV